MQHLAASPRDAFDQWFHAVDRLMVNALGLGPDDIEDWDWYAHFRDGLSPQEAFIAWREDVFDLEL